jgi:hypothetical protein
VVRLKNEKGGLVVSDNPAITTLFPPYYLTTWGKEYIDRGIYRKVRKRGKVVRS